MKTSLLLCVIATAYIATAVPIKEEELKVYPRFVSFPDGEGLPHIADLQAEPDHALLEEIQRDPANNLYLLFTRNNPTQAQTLIINNAESILNSNFNPEDNTIVIVHGWLGGQDAGINPTVRDAYLGKGPANVIVLDWRRLALSNYVTAVIGVPDVGVGLGQFVRFLISVTGIPYESIHLAGFSLGAHIVGNAGRELEGRVARVTGLDPAGPLWHYNDNKITENDGIYVEAIHTNGGVDGLGIGSIVANVDFFPNGGRSQPGCLTFLCDHDRSWELFGASVTYNHLTGAECYSSTQVTLNSCRGPPFPLGNDNLTKTGSGFYRVNTGRRYPF
ncbi:pancreatic lipase-related protein 2-like [Achroia grisella]|uniref:pancreatic lipase-related protein 2-like n=1 Tax=Achroia grisella TaxID=688607 RepID=UPI0027D265AB|nr:pancreatic lipase-related protein 2-like [Achroia grisella]